MTIGKRAVLPQAGNRPDRRGDRCYPGDRPATQPYADSPGTTCDVKLTRAPVGGGLGQVSGGSEAGWSRSASASSRRLEIPSFS
jgi:hypothetical protein